MLWCTLCAAQCDTDQYTVLLAQVDKADQELLLAALLGNNVVCCTCGGALQPDIDFSATAARRKMHKLHVYVVGGDYADNGVDQLIIDGEAMPVLKALIKEGKSPGVGEGAVRLLTRLCSTPEARQEVRSASLPHKRIPHCLASVVSTCCIIVLLLLMALIMSTACLSAVSFFASPTWLSCNPAVVITPDAVKDTQAPMHKRRHVSVDELHPFSSHCASSRLDICCKPLLYSVLHHE